MSVLVRLQVLLNLFGQLVLAQKNAEYVNANYTFIETDNVLGISADDSEQYCQNELGSHLGSFHSDDDLDSYFELLTNHDHNFDFSWMGYYKEGDSWGWRDGSYVDNDFSFYSRYLNDNGADCVYFDDDGSRSAATWDCSDPWDSYYFVCNTPRTRFYSIILRLSGTTDNADDEDVSLNGIIFSKMQGNIEMTSDESESWTPWFALVYNGMSGDGTEAGYVAIHTTTNVGVAQKLLLFTRVNSSLPQHDTTLKSVIIADITLSPVITNAQIASSSDDQDACRWIVIDFVTKSFQTFYENASGPNCSQFLQEIYVNNTEQDVSEIFPQTTQISQDLPTSTMSTMSTTGANPVGPVATATLSTLPTATTGPDSTTGFTGSTGSTGANFEDSGATSTQSAVEPVETSAVAVETSSIATTISEQNPTVFRQSNTDGGAPALPFGTEPDNSSKNTKSDSVEPWWEWLLIVLVLLFCLTAATWVAVVKIRRRRSKVSERGGEGSIQMLDVAPSANASIGGTAGGNTQGGTAGGTAGGADAVIGGMKLLRTISDDEEAQLYREGSADGGTAAVIAVPEGVEDSADDDLYHADTAGGAVGAMDGNVTGAETGGATRLPPPLKDRKTPNAEDAEDVGADEGDLEKLQEKEDMEVLDENGGVTFGDPQVTKGATEGASPTTM